MMQRPMDGLGFDTMVFESLAKNSESTDRRTSLNVARTEKELGLTGDQILRAINMIRSKGHLVISMSTRRNWENDFKFPSSQSDYIEWRSKMTDDMKTLSQVLAICDAAAKAKYGIDMPTQPPLPI